MRNFWFNLILAVLIGATSASEPSFAAEPKVRRNVQIEFETVEGATFYEVQVVRKDDRSKKQLRFKTKEPLWEANIKPGIYEMQVRAYDDRDVPGDWSPPTDLQVRLPAIIVKGPAPEATVQASDAKEQEVKLEWEPIPGAQSYKVILKGANDAFKIEKEVKEPRLETAVPVGHEVSWNVAAVDDRGEDGEQSSDMYKFKLQGPPLEKPQISKPISKYVRELEWAAPDNATYYSYNLSYYNPKKKGWESVAAKADSKENKFKMDVTKPSGKYRLQVQAHGEYRNPSKPAQLDFYSQGGFKDEKEFDNAILRDSVVKPTNFYAIASYLLTQIDYKFAHSDAGTSATFGAIGGTGRIGAGYQEPRSNWGGFGIIDYSGFTIQGQNFTFASMEVHVTRKMEFGQGGLLLFGSGLFSKELPLVDGNPTDGFIGVGKVRGNGPHAGFSYWFPINDRFGAQVNARLYYTMFGSSSSGAKAQGAMTMQYGLLGSYRLGRSWMGYAGYVFRKDEAQYAANPDASVSFAEGRSNVITIQGHYLNLVLEWSF